MGSNYLHLLHTMSIQAFINIHEKNTLQKETIKEVL